MAEDEYNLHFVCETDESSPEQIHQRMEEFARQLASSSAIRVQVLDDQGEPVDSQPSCDPKVLKLNVMFKTCSVRLTLPRVPLDEEKYVKVAPTSGAGPGAPQA